MRRQEEIQKKQKLEVDDRDRQRRFLEQQMERDRESAPSQKVSEATELRKKEDDGKLPFDAFWCV